jgi:hypothetical protein
VRLLLPGAGSSAVIVTSRQKLTGLSGARLLVLDVLSDTDAAQLFTRIVGEDRVRAEPVATASVVAKCGGLPLAIRIAAARLAGNPGWQVSAFERRLASAGRRRTLDEFATGDLALRNCFEPSYRSLDRGPGSPDRGPNLLARTFRLLGLADMPVLGTAAVAALTGSTEASSAVALAALADVHLVESPAPGRYRLHDLLRVYAAERTCEEESPDERTAALRRLLEWYLRMASSAVRAADPFHKQPQGSPVRASAAFAGTRQALDWFDSERPNLAAAIEQAASRDMHDIAARLAAAMRILHVRCPSGVTMDDRRSSCVGVCEHRGV